MWARKYVVFYIRGLTGDGFVIPLPLTVVLVFNFAKIKVRFGKRNQRKVGFRLHFFSSDEAQSQLYVL